MNRTLPVTLAILIGTALAGRVSAQSATPTAPDYPRGRISGYLFGDYYYNAAGDPAHVYGAGGVDLGQANIDGSKVITKDLNGLQVRRAYVQLDNDLSARYATRVRLEADGKSLTSDGKVGVAVKGLHVQAKSVAPRMDVFAGLLSVPLYETIEDYWGYRSIEKTMPDFRGFSPSADFGVQVKGAFDGNKVWNYSVLLGNGAGQKNENNRQKRINAGFPIRWKDLRVEPYVDYENIYGGNDRCTLQGFVGYDLPRHLSVGYVASNQVRHAPTGPYTELRGHSVFARIQAKETLGAFARVDYFMPNKRAANRVDQQLWIAGVDWQPFKDVHVMPNVESIQYRAKGTGVVPPHHDLQARLTFYWRFTRPQS